KYMKKPVGGSNWLNKNRQPILGLDNINKIDFSFRSSSWAIYCPAGQLIAQYEQFIAQIFLPFF
ncbi:hypothetical protein, partial [uncultured Shewanella sp.]|uniref:hypothetical protein n=1 Tax=uncultured Shewanella sp. TaxID=173975 RepID=UPI00262FF273